MRALSRFLVALAASGCGSPIDDATQSVDLAECRIADNERECVLGALGPGDCYQGVCFPELTQWEAGEQLAEPYCANSDEWWCSKEAVFTWCGGSKVDHCTEIVEDGVLLDQCLRTAAPDILPDECAGLF